MQACSELRHDTAASSRGEDGNACRRRGLGEALVVGDDRIEIVAQVQGGRQVDRVEAPQQGRVESAGAVENGRAERSDRHGIEHGSRPENTLRVHPTYGPDEFRAGEITGHGFPLGLGQPGAERIGLGLFDHQLHQGRRVEIVRHLSTVRRPA